MGHSHITCYSAPSVTLKRTHNLESSKLNSWIIRLPQNNQSVAPIDHVIIHERSLIMLLSLVITR